MKTRLTALVLAAALGALAAASGCVPNRASVQVQAICYPTQSCSFRSTCDVVFGGVAGINGAGTLVLFVQVENQLPNNENLDTHRLNTNDAHVTEVHVEYEGGQANIVDVGANSRVPAGGSVVVPIGLYIFGAGEILAHVRLRGHLDDGSSFETGDFPISVYAGPSACGTSVCATAADTCPPGGAGQCPVNCAATGSGSTGFTVGGTISGLTGSGLILSTPGYPDVSVSAGANTFTFDVADGATYDITIRQQPTGQTCTVTPGTGTGTVSGGNVTSVRITCV